MDHALDWLWQGCVVGLATLLILRLLARSRAHARYVLCWVALLAVLVLPVLSSFWVDPAQLERSLPGATPVATVVSVPIAWWTSTTVLLALWVCWSGVQGVRLFCAQLALRRVRRDCLPFPMAAESRLRHWKAMRLEGRQARLVLARGVRSAAVLGGGAPLIAVAPALVDHLSADELDRVVIHEWAHVQRRDDVLNVFQLAARVVGGWHPAAWWLDRQLQIERESACDERAVGVTGCAKHYAASLARTASLLPARHTMLPVVGAWSSPALSQRVVRILSHGQLFSTTRSIRAAMAAAAAVCALAFAVAGVRIVGMEAVLLAQERQPLQAVVLERIAVRVPATSQLPSQTSSDDGRSRQSPPRPRHSQQETRDTLTESAAPAPVDFSPLPLGDGRLAVVPFPATVNLISSLDAPAPPAITSSAPSPLPTVSDHAAAVGSAAADAGVAVGRASQKAAVTTAVAFTRLGKKIAGSF
jgi:beta-lactamase regulating signal transducer with metallopeptidase domain